MSHVGDAPKAALNSMSATEGFVGRGPELDRISTLLLGSARLITLVGSGGIGKTRLATEAVGRFRKAKPISVHWVRLARLSKGSGKAAVAEEVAAAVAGADFSDRSAWDAIVDTLTGPGPAGNSVPTVLVMDNCEHVLEEVGRFIADLLEAVAGLTVVATSREAIGWVDEHVVVVPPLTRQQALALFRQRAELTGHSISDREQLATARLICRHVHNHPLYIRLAAARLLRQPLAMILHELSGEAADKRMRWSHGPRLGAEPRHRGSAMSLPGHTICAWKRNGYFWIGCRFSPPGTTPILKMRPALPVTSVPTWKLFRWSAPMICLRSKNRCALMRCRLWRPRKSKIYSSGSSISAW